MKYATLLWMSSFLLLMTSACQENNSNQKDHQEGDATFPESRDPKNWPFSQSSIWNMPVGANARYVHANIERAMDQGMTIDEDIIVMTENAPLTPVYVNNAGWDRNKNRCTVEGKLLFEAPIPDDFVVGPDTWDGLTPNSGLAVLMPDGHTIKQTQPFARCIEGDTATSKYMFEDQDLYGEGTFGAHGGSGLSAIGGALRLGELRPSSGPLRHALKVNVYAAKNLYYDEHTKGYRWPAIKSDSYAADNYGTKRTTTVVKECRMGALLALPANWDIDTMGFETIPGRMLAKAFQTYGAYVVDDTAWDVYAIVTEWGPDGRFAEQFYADWGFSIKEASKNTPWARDMDRIFLNLHVVVNNSPSSVGGGGDPLVPPAPKFN